MGCPSPGRCPKANSVLSAEFAEALAYIGRSERVLSKNWKDEYGRLPP
jgi:hypothetical protein